MKNHHIKIVVLLLLTAFAYIPFSGKALHIDDPLFYHTAKQVIRNPLDPYSYEIVWFGKKERLFDFFSNPPLLGYYIALIINFLGEGERTLHISLLLFTIISALSMYFLSIRFISMPLVSALFFIFSPICMVMGQTLMPDMALAAFFLLSITLFIHGYDKNNPLFLLISGISAAIAVLTRYNGISIIPLITLYYLLYFDKKKKWGVAVIIFPIISILLWNIYTLEIYGKMHLLSQLKFQSYGSRLSITKILIHLLPHIAYLGGGTIFPLLFFVPFFSGIRKKPVFLSILLLGTVCCVYIPLRKFTHYNLINFSLGVLFLTGPVFILLYKIYKWVMNYTNKKKLPKDEMFLILWIFGILVMQNSGIQSSAKYMIIAIPPLVLLTLKCFFSEETIMPLCGATKDENKQRGLSSRQTPMALRAATKHENRMLFSGQREVIGKSKFEGIFIYVSLVLTISLGLLISYADYSFAGAYKKMSEYVAEIVKGEEPYKIYFAGHWGFQYYMEKKGYIAYEEKSNALNKGDFLVLCLLAHPQKIDERLSRRIIIIEVKDFGSDLPIRIMHNFPGKQANFYSYINFLSGFGILPYSISLSPIEKLVICRVIRE